MLYLEKPKDFVPDIETVGCFVVWKKKVLLLKRTPESKYGGLWGLPSGHIEPGESPAQAMIRELWEETRIEANFLQFLGEAFISFPDRNYIFYLYQYDFLDHEYPVIVIDLLEHIEYRFDDLKGIIAIGGNVTDTENCVKHFCKN